MIHGFFNVYTSLLVCVSIRLVIEEYRANWIYPSDGAWKKCVRPKFFSQYRNPTWPKTQWEKFSNHGDTDNPVHPFYGENFHLYLACTFYGEKFFLPSHSHITYTPARTFSVEKFHLLSHSRTFSLPRTCSPAKEISLAESNFQYWTLKFRNRIFSIVRLLVKWKLWRSPW